MQSEKVSIILPTYNRAEKLKKSLGSVLEQTYTEFEVILVDDGSIDHTEEVVRSFHDNRIKYYHAGLNRGAAAARNYGLEQATCNYIAFQDSDDVWHKNKLEKQMEVLLKSSKETGFVYHKIQYDLGDNYCAVLPSEEIALERKSGDIYAQMLYDNLIPCPSILMKRSCLERTGKFDIELKALEDYDFALKMTKCSRAVFIDEILLDASYSTEGVSGNAVNYLIASCLLLQRYKKDYLATKTLNHRLEIILRDSQALGLQEQFISLLEKVLQ